MHKPNETNAEIPPTPQPKKREEREREKYGLYILDYKAYSNKNILLDPFWDKPKSKNNHRFATNYT